MLWWTLLVSVALMFLVPGVAQAQECNPNHPETCECNPYHPETCPEPSPTHGGAAFFVAEKSGPSVGSDLKLAGLVALAVVGLALVTRLVIANARRE